MMLLLACISLLVIRSHCFVCERGWIQFKNKCFREYEHAVTFADAAHVCRDTLSGSLASVDSDREQDFLVDTFFPLDENEKSTDKWIGGIRVSASNRTDAFRWLDGSKFNVTKWAPGQPDNHQTSEYCVAMWGGETGRGSWYDFRCDRKLPAICERMLILPTILSSHGDSDLPLFSFEVSDLYERYHAAVHGRDAAVRTTHFLALLAAALTGIIALLACYADFSGLRNYYRNRHNAFLFFKFDDSSIPS